MDLNLTIDKRYFLNQTALYSGTDPLLLNPYQSLRELCDELSPEAMQERFTAYCEAAVAPVYNWRKETPEMLIAFSGVLEQLTEICFLISIFQKDKAPDPKKQLAPDPAVLRGFFKSQALPGWKSWIRTWTLAAASDRSVAEMVRQEDLIPFVQCMEKLLASIKTVDG